MPWHKVPESSKCPTSKPWAVVKDSDGSVAGCHATEAEADDQLAALYASEDADMTKAATFAKLDETAHAGIQSDVADAHGIKADAVDSSDDGDKLTVTAKHDDGTSTTTEHELDDAGNVVESEGSDDNANPDAEKAQIKAVESSVAKPSDSEGDGGDEPKKPSPFPAKKAAASAKRKTWTGQTAAGEEISVVETGDEMPDEVDNSFEMPIMVIEGEWTGDGRFINPGCLSWRDMPLPVMALTKTTFAHDDAELVGRIDSIDRRSPDPEDINSHTGQPFSPDTSILFAKGTFDTAEMAQEVKRLVADGMLRGVSVDIGDAESELVYLDADGNEIDDPYDDMDIWDLLFGFSASGDDEEAEPDETSDTEKPEIASMGERITSGRIMGATICPFPAFEGAYITIGTLVAGGVWIMPIEVGYKGQTMPGINIVDKQGERKMPKTQLESLVASGGLAAPMVPPVEWFANPKLTGPTAITITEEGEVYGHLACWGECHMSYTNQCINPPKSFTDYAYFRTGAVLCENDSLIPTGVITMNTGHAELWQDPASTKAHYDNTGTAVVDVACGDDAYGIWVHGSLRPDVDQLSIRRLRGAALSGDWRQMGGNLELVAALAVNVPGFAVRRPAARVAAGAPMALVAAGRVTQDDAIKLRNRKAPVKRNSQGYTQRDMDVLAGYVRSDLRTRVHGQNGR